MPNDKRTRSIRESLKNTLKYGGRYATGTAKLFLASGKDMFTAEMPTVTGMFDVNKELLQDAVRFLRNPTDVINTQIDRATQSESYQELKRFVKYALDDLKTGNLYDANRDRTELGMQMDEMMSSFAGFDMEGFDENGDWSEPEYTTEDIDAQVKIAEVQEENAGKRTEATISAIGTAAGAIIDSQNANSQQALRMNMKQHQQVMNTLQNSLATQASTFELMSKSINAQLDLTKEVHGQVMSQLSDIKSILTEIRDNTAPKVPEKQKTREQEDIFGINGELDIKKYLKSVVGQINDYYGIGNSISIATGGLSPKQIIETVISNPWQLVTNQLLQMMVPKSTINKMRTTNKNLGSFAPALLQKFGDRRKKVEAGEGNIFDLLLSFLGPKTRSSSTITTEYENPVAQATITNKTTRAIEEVIPMWLSRIYSAISGSPLEVYNYSTGKLEQARNIVASNTRNANDLTGRLGEGAYEIQTRAGKYNFKNSKEAEKFQNFIYEYLQKQAEDNSFINPYVTREEFMKTMPSAYQSGNEADVYYSLLMGIMRAMPRDKLAAISKEIYDARISRDRDNASINNKLKESGTIAAFSGFLPNDVTSQIEYKSKQGKYGLNDNDLSEIDKEYRKRLIRNGSGTAATNMILSDILGTLKKGIITYSYNIGKRVEGSDISDIFRNVMSEASNQNDSEARLRQIIIDDDRRRMERIRQEEQNAREQQRNNIAPSLNEIITGNYETPDSAEKFQRLVSINETKPGESNNPEVERERKAQEEHRKQMQSMYAATLNGNIDTVLKKTGAKGILDKAKEYMTTPFKLFEDALSVTDAFLYKMLFGDDAIGQLDLNGEPFLLQTLTNSLKKHFADAKDWFGENIGNPLKKYLFDKDEGLIPRIGKSLAELLGLDTLKDKAKNKVSDLKKKLIERTIGMKNEDGTYSGGRLSGTINKVHKTGDTIDQTISNAVGRLLYGDYASGKGVKRVTNRDTKTGRFTSGSHKEYGGVIGSLRKGFDKTKEYLFGPEDEDTESKQKFNKVTSELNKAFPDMIVGGGLGIIGSMLLPGGPLLGAVIGSTAGLVRGSNQLATFLFGEEAVEYETDKKGNIKKDKDGNPIVKSRSRSGGLISKDVYEGVKKFAPKIGIGAAIGSLAGGLGLLPFGMGQIAGMVFGAMGGMTVASDKIKELIFGDGVDPDSGLLSKNFKDKVLNQVKRYAPGGIGGAALGNMLGSGLGLIPGLSLLPTGPIFTLMGSMMGVANADAINKFFFGTEAEVAKEVIDDDGNKRTVTTKERQGGIFNKVYDYARDHLLTPFAKKFDETGQKIQGWFNESIIGPLQRSIKPLQDRMSEAGRAILNSFSNIGEHITNSLFHTFNISINGEDGKQGLHEFFQEHVLKRLKDMSNRMFDAIGKLIGSIISAPFKALELIVTGKIGDKEGKKDDLEESGGFFSGLHSRLQESRKKSAQRRADRASRRASRYGTSFMDRMRAIFGYDTESTAEESVTSTASSIQTISDEQRARNNSLKERLLAKRNGTILSTDTFSGTQGFDISSMNDRQIESYMRWRKETGGKGNRADYRNWLKVDNRRNRTTSSANAPTANQQSLEQSDAAINERRSKNKVGKKTNNEYLESIAKYTKKIYNEIKGQVNGVGWNTAYIKTILEKQYGPLGSDELPEEMEGSTKKIRKRRGIVGKALDFLGDKFGGIKDRAMGAIDKAKGVLGIIFHPFQLIAEGAKYAYGALKGFGKGIWEITKTAGSMLKEILLGAAKGLGGILAGAGKFIAASAKGVGEALGNTLGTLTGVIHDTVLGISSIATGLIQTAAEIFPDVVKGLWKGAKALGKGAVKVAGAGIRGVASGAGWLMNKVTGKDKDGNVTKIKKKFLGNVNIIGGKLDKIDSEVPISVGDSINRIPFPYVNLIKGKSRRRTTEAIPVYVAGFDRYARLPKSGDSDNSNNTHRTDEFKQAYDDVDRRAEKSNNPAEVYDRAVRDAKNQEEVQAILAAQQMNATNKSLIPVSGSGSQEEKSSSGFLETMMTMLSGGSGGILKTLGGVLAGTTLGKMALSIFSKGKSAASTVTSATTSALLKNAPFLLGTANAVSEGEYDRVATNVAKQGVKVGSWAARSATGALDILTTPQGAETTTKAASGLGAKLLATFRNGVFKLLSNNTVKAVLSKFHVDSGKILETVTKNFDNVLLKLSGEAMQQLLKKANLVLLVATAVYDFVSGMADGPNIFKVDSGDCTMGMRACAGLGKAISGLAFGLIPVSWLSQTIYKIFAPKEVENELTKKQESMKQKQQAYNAANGTDLTLEEYMDQENDSGLLKMVKNVGSSIWSGIKSIGSGIKNFFTGGDSGKGPMKHFSQSDGRWNRNDPTMKNVGCGPTAAAMVASAYGKGRANPSEANMMSKALGMRASDGGTDPNFFRQYAAGKGFGMEQGPATSGMLSSNLSKGRPAVLMGKGGVFGDNVHYLVADKLAGKGKANVVDPITGGSKTVTMDSLLRNTSNAIYSYGKGPETDDNTVETTDGKVSVGDAQQALVNKMKSIYGKINYSQSTPQDPDKGQASCASTVAWAYQKVLGYRPGGGNYASSSGQSTDSNFVTIYQNNGTPINPNIMQPGDIVYINWDKTSFDKSLAKPMQHTEMYAGNLQDLSHGGKPQYGPVYKNLTSDRISHIMKVRRYKPFTTGQNLQIYDDGSSSNIASGMEIGDYSSEPAGIAALNTISDIFSSVGSKYDRILNVFMNQKSEDDEEATSGDTSVDGISSDIPVTEIRGNTTAQQIVNFLKDHKFNNYGIAGIMGNMYKESGLLPNNLQNEYNTKFGLSDEEYTKRTDDGSYTNFTTDSGGYGLVQWTPKSRKTRLYNLAKKRNKSVSDVGTQLDLMLQELTEYGLLGGLQYATSVKDASDKFLYNFEKPANASKQSDARAQAAQSFYDQLINDETGKGPGFSWGKGPSANLVSLNRKVQDLNKNMQDVQTAAAEETTVAKLTDKINDIVTTKSSGTSKENDTLLAISKTLATMVELLAAIKDNTAQNTEAKKTSTSSSSKTPTANADSFSSNPYVYGENEDVGSKIIDALTTK